MITARKLRDAAFAVLLAIPTLSMTRPVATEAMSPASAQSPVLTNAAMAELTTDERRVQVPLER